MNTEFNEADMTLALEAAGYTTYGPAEEKACKLAQIVLAASREKLMEQEPVGVTDMTGGIYWKRGAPIQAKLYAAPMPQANESDAVKALRELVRLHENRQYIGDCPEGWVQAIEHARAVLAGEPGAKGEQHKPLGPASPEDQAIYDGMATNYHKGAEQPKQAQAIDEREAIKQIIIEHLTGVYICNRVWEAWNVGTMDQDDFEAAQETELPDELADALMARAALAQAQASGKAAPSDEPCWYCGERGQNSEVDKQAPTIDRNAIIEECADIADLEAEHNFGGSMSVPECAEEIARRIRILKDAPKEST